MTGVEFHFNAPSKLAYACRLLRKAVGKGAKVVVTGEPEVLRDLDTALWTFSPLEFVPHCHADAHQAVLDASPVILSDSAPMAPHRQVLLNLGACIPEGFERFERLIEVVTQGEEDRQQARERWKHYASCGYALKRKDLELKDGT